ncbi:hypothetical protein CAOG_03415 [Capsaspora owczarzaki ATCC 30864]|uniref:Uncharacterized protein n=1 Tax=Capsaspora owczarzaki (strain ATCC 30864) TaxID=595528 RepID=A0A0D2WP89_CAPO3|nr:hypothetical protein CAOG_03415 [Capsaspora owczarzaki ATCC 30864]KJE92438.1 hypothetical protein CAOG_003415 [Capsaspora owczarzaki ATCC 30864]|eukprot:XP_004364254.1 hypothetical protein CAOG_03415 [Capsaspora owczarzaki ATCC 30864]
MSVDVSHSISIETNKENFELSENVASKFSSFSSSMQVSNAATSRAPFAQTSANRFNVNMDHSTQSKLRFGCFAFSKPTTIESACNSNIRQEENQENGSSSSSTPVAPRSVDQSPVVASSVEFQSPVLPRLQKSGASSDVQGSISDNQVTERLAMLSPRQQQQRSVERLQLRLQMSASARQRGSDSLSRSIVFADLKRRHSLARLEFAPASPVQTQATGAVQSTLSSTASPSAAASASCPATPTVLSTSRHGPLTVSVVAKGTLQRARQASCVAVPSSSWCYEFS